MAPSIQRVGDRRFYVMPETEVSIFEAPPTYDDALKHPSVPPSARSFADVPITAIGLQSVARPTSSVSLPIASAAFDNPTFTTDSEVHILDADSVPEKIALFLDSRTIESSVGANWSA